MSLSRRADFNGIGHQATLLFTVDSTPWEIRWTTDSKFDVGLFDPETSREVVRLVNGQPSGSTLVYTQRGTFYLTIFAEPDAAWNLAIAAPPSVEPSVVSLSRRADFNGIGHQATLPFTVDSTPWELRWTTDSKFDVGLFDPETSREVVRLVNGQPSGSTLVYTQRGTFYLTIFAEPDAAWELTVSVPMAP